MNANLEIGKRLEACRHKKGLTLEEVGTSLGLHRSTILRYERGYTAKIKQPILQKLAEVLDTTPAYLMYGYEAPEPAPDSTDMLRSRLRYEPSPVQSAACTDSSLPSPLSPYIVREPLPLLSPSELSAQHRAGTLPPYFIVPIADDEMSPRIRRGDYVVVARGGTVEGGQLGLLCIEENQLVIKKLIHHRDGITLVAYNPEIEPQVYSNEEIHRIPVTIIGTVREVHGHL